MSIPFCLTVLLPKTLHDLLKSSILHDFMTKNDIYVSCHVNKNIITYGCNST